MKIERAINTKRNIVVGFVGKVISILFPFLIRTATIKMLGPEYLGLDSLFASILQVLNITELGISSAIVYSMYKPIAIDDNETVCALLNFYRKVYRWIGIVILGLGLLLVPFLSGLINSNPSVGTGIPETVNVYFVYLIFLFNTAISYLLFAYKNAIPNAMQRVDQVIIVNTASKMICYLSQLIVLIIVSRYTFDDGIVYYLYLSWLPISTIINNVLIAKLVDKKYPQYSCRGILSEKIKHDIKVKVSGLVINKVCSTTRNALDSICVSAFLGLTLTTMYNNYFYIITAINGVVSIIISSILAGVGNSVATESVDKNYQDMRKMDFIYMWLAMFCTACLLTLYQPFMMLWVGKELIFDYKIVICFCIYFYVLKIGDIRSVYFDASGLWWENRYKSILEAICNITLNVVLGKLWGIYGIILATIFSIVFINFGYGTSIVFRCYFGKDKLLQYLIQHMVFAVTSFITCLICVWGCNYITVQLSGFFQGESSVKWLAILISNGVFTLLISNLVYFIIYSNTSIYKESTKWLRDRIKR